MSEWNRPLRVTMIALTAMLDVGQKSGPISFKDAGEYKVNCAIHPKMSLKVIVEK